MKSIEGFIRENKEKLNSFEPEEGHLMRFQQKLQKKNLRKSVRTDRIILRAALIAALLTLGGLMYYKYQKNNQYKADRTEIIQDTNQFSLSEISPEFREVEIYLKSNVNKKLTEFENIECKHANIDKNEIYKELEELDKTYIELQEELKNGPKDERIINAMIDCYQSKIELLNLIITQVNKNCQS